MKMLKQLLCASLAAAVALLSVGCASNSKGEITADEDIPLGRYVETDITPSPAVPAEGSPMPYSLGVYPDVDGAMYYIATVSATSAGEREKLLYYRSLDNGGTWESMDTKWYDALFDKYDSLEGSLLKCAAFGSDGTLYCLLTMENNWYKVVRIKEDAAQEIPLEGWEEQSFYDALQGFFIQSFEILPNNDIVISFDIMDQYSFIYDSNTGKLKKQLETMDAAVFFGKDIYAKLCYDASVQGNAVQAFGYDDAEKFKQPVEVMLDEDTHLAGDADNLYLIKKDGVYRFGKNASGEQIMPADFYTFGSPSWYVKEFKYSGSTKNLYAILKNSDDGSERLFRYWYDASAPSRASGELAVFSLNDSDTLRQAISIYQRSHPEIQVNLEIGLLQNSAVTKEDVIRVLNTELLAKKGPDILILDGLPIETYVEKGVLADLSDLAESKDLFPNIAKAYATGRGIYAIPARYEIPVLCGEKALVDSLESLPQIAEQARKFPPISKQAALSNNEPVLQENRPLTAINSPWDAIRLFYSTYRPNLIPDGKTIDARLLSELFAETKTFVKQMDAAEEDLNWDEYAKSMSVLSFDPEEVYGGQTLLGVTNLRDFGDCFHLSRSAPQKSGEKVKSADLYFLPLCGPSRNVFIPHCVAALNVSSAKADDGKEFIETILSAEVQSPSYSEGFPVNRTAFKARYDESKTRWSISYLTDMEQLAASLTTPVTIDETILEAVLDEVKPYYKDEETLEEAVDHIGAKLRTYLAEKS